MVLVDCLLQVSFCSVAQPTAMQESGVFWDWNSAVLASVLCGGGGP